MTDDEEPMLSVGRAAKKLGVHPNTLWRWISSGVVVYTKVGPYGRVRVRASDLIRPAELPAEPPTDPKPHPTKAPDAAIEAKLIEMRGASRRR